MKDLVRITDELRLNSSAEIPREKEVVQIEGFFSCFARERGKLVPLSRREGKNIWTLTGREYLALLMSYSLYGTTAHTVGAIGTQDVPYRDDRIRYLGFGTGSQPEVAGVTKLVTPISYDGTNFLAQTGNPTFPLTPTKSTVQFSRLYTELELSVAGSVVLTEAGLYTDGDESTHAPKSRSILLVNAANQAPVAYKTFEAFRKTSNFSLQVDWQIRF